jgi:hypothetical protein
VDNDGDCLVNEDPRETPVDNDGDGLTDEDGPGDMNNDGLPGVGAPGLNSDDDGDGLADFLDYQVLHSMKRAARQDNYTPALDDDEDGLSDEDGDVYRSGIWVVKVNEFGLPQDAEPPISLTNDGGRQPFFNPDGSDLLYVRNIFDDASLAGDIMRLTLDIQPDTVIVLETTNLTNSSSLEAYPSYSADGERIVYTSSFHGTSDIWIMPAAGPPGTRVTNLQGQELFPRFTPAGNQILFEAWLFPGGERRAMITVGELP